MENKFIFVDFKKWCPKCKYFSYPEKSDPCVDCLNMGANEQSSKPVLFEERRKDGGREKTSS